MFGKVLTNLKDPSFLIASAVVAVVTAFFIIPAITRWQASRSDSTGA